MVTQNNSEPKSLPDQNIRYTRGFPQIDHSASSARIVLEQINSAKKLPLTGIEPSILGL